MSHQITFKLSLLEARGLLAIADEGGEGLFNDEEAGKAYIGDARAIKAARRALEKLGTAVVRAKAEVKS